MAPEQGKPRLGPGIFLPAFGWVPHELRWFPGYELLGRSVPAEMLLGFDNYLEGVLRGHQKDLLEKEDYRSLGECKTPEELREHLQDTIYGEHLEGEAAGLRERCFRNMKQEFTYFKENAAEPLTTFLAFLEQRFMLDNILLLLLGLSNKTDLTSLVGKCHPLGLPVAHASLRTVTSAPDLYNLFVAETPFGDCFSELAAEADLQDAEKVRSRLYNTYLEKFATFCKSLPGPLVDGMSTLLEFDADRRAVQIAMGVVAKGGQGDSEALYPRLGQIGVECFRLGFGSITRAEDLGALLTHLETIGEPITNWLAEGGKEHPLEWFLQRKEMALCREAFRTQFSFAIFYAYFRLKEQEIRNIEWLCICLGQNRREHLLDSLP